MIAIKLGNKKVNGMCDIRDSKIYYLYFSINHTINESKNRPFGDRRCTVFAHNDDV